MLSLNKISISCSDSKVLDEIFNILNTKSVDYDMNNYHLYSKSNVNFLELFFDGTKPYDEFGFEWAYIESCVKSESILLNIYSNNGNLSIWVAELLKKYKMYKPIEFEIDISIEITKSVKFKNYDIKKYWIESELPKVIQNKKGL